MAKTKENKIEANNKVNITETSNPKTNKLKTKSNSTK